MSERTYRVAFLCPLNACLVVGCWFFYGWDWLLWLAAFDLVMAVAAAGCVYHHHVGFGRLGSLRGWFGP